MSKRKIIILSGAAFLVVLGILAAVLRGRPQDVVFGLLFVAGFVNVFGGFIILLQWLKERFFVSPRNPTHLCLHCYSLYEKPETTRCEYCQEKFGLIKPLSEVENFLDSHSLADIQARRAQLEIDLKKALGRNIVFIEHDLKNLQRIMRIYEVRQKTH